MTNQHVVSDDIVKNEKKILIKYENEKKMLEIKLDEEERIIIYFKDILNIDVTIIEIIPKDQIDGSYFLFPKTNFCISNQNQIQVVQYPSGRYLSISNGCIMGIYCDNINYFYHNASTKFGSSGSPIFFYGEDEVFAIHKGTTKDRQYNIGIFIGVIIEIMKEYKKNGKYKEYYNDGKIKYEGNFKDDEYNDNNGQYIFENGDVYIGQFKNGKKHGNGLLVNKDNVFIKECVYEYDIEINKEENFQIIMNYKKIL